MFNVHKHFYAFEVSTINMQKIAIMTHTFLPKLLYTRELVETEDGYRILTPVFLEVNQKTPGSLFWSRWRSLLILFGIPLVHE